MSTKAAVNNFLRDLVQKIDTFRIVFEERKNFKELLKMLDYTQSDCIVDIKQLTAKNYHKGPITDTINQGEYWEFGKMIKNIEV